MHGRHYRGLAAEKSLQVVSLTLAHCYNSSLTTPLLLRNKRDQIRAEVRDNDDLIPFTIKGGREDGWTVE